MTDERPDSVERVLAKIEARRNELVAEIQRLDAAISVFREFLASADRRAAKASRQPGGTGGKVEPIDPFAGSASLLHRGLLTGEAPAPSGEVMLQTARVAREVIQAIGRPVTTREMLSEFQKRAIPVGGRDPLATLSARLSRTPDLENRRPFGWAIAEPAKKIGAAGQDDEVQPAVSDPNPNASPVEPAAGGGT
jgi:hypothetical protein